MGLNTTVVICNDAVHELSNDISFVKRLANAMHHISYKPCYPIQVAIGTYSYGCQIIIY